MIKKVIFSGIFLTLFGLNLYGDCQEMDGANNVNNSTIIGSLQNVDEDKNICIKGSVKKSSDNKDYYKFRVGTDGTLKIDGSSPNSRKYNLMIGSSKNGSEYYGETKDKNHDSDLITLHKDDIVYIGVRRVWNNERKYKLNFNFTKKQSKPFSDNTITLTGVLRDFNQNHVDFEPHMNWENGSYGGMFNFFDGVQGGLQTGYVKQQLDSDRKPLPNPSNHHPLKPKKLYEWYHDVNGVNMSMPYSIVLHEIGEGVYQFSSNAFFPADGKLFGKENYHGQTGTGFQHNFHMTYELHTKFTYKQGQVFNFVGDDDVWCFINNKLVVDLGGLHTPESSAVNLGTLGLVEGQSYNFDFFWAERHTTGSNFTITTSIELEETPPTLISVDTVSNFPDDGYESNKTIIVGDNHFTLDAVLLNQNSTPINYRPNASNTVVPMTVLLYTQKDEDDNPKLISDTHALFTGGNSYARSNEISLDSLTAGSYDIKVKYLDFYDESKVNLQQCANSSQLGNLKGLPQCVNSSNKYKTIFGENAYQKCKINNGSPCSSNHSGKGNKPYDHEYGCYECTIDAIWGTEPKDTTSKLVKEENATPFTCSQDGYLFSGNAHARDAHTINLGNGEYALQQDNLDYQINATGYNVKDNLIWGYDINTHKVIEIDANYTITSYDIPGLPEKKYYAGDVSLDGILYLKHHDTKKIYKIDLNNGIPVYDGVITLSKSENFGDFAFNPVDKMLYSISENDRHLYKINPEDGQLTDLGENFNEDEYEKFHTFVFDRDGNLYFYGLSGKIYKINLSADAYAPYQHILFTTTEIKSGGGDGARCPNALVTPKDVTLESVLDVNQSEGDSGITNMKFTIKFNHPVPAATEENDVSFWVSVTDGGDGGKVEIKAPTSWAGVSDTHTGSESDFAFTATCIRFVDNPENKEPGEECTFYKAGKTSYDINVSILGDLYVEPDEEFYLDIYAASNINLGKTNEDGKFRAVGTILNDDKPFTCDDTMYLSNAAPLGIHGHEDDYMYLHSIDRSGSPFKFDQIGEKYDKQYNALAYNPKDDYLYATYKNILLKIDSDGVVKELGEIEGLGEHQNYAATFDKDGYYYLSDWSDRKKLYKIDIKTRKVSKTITLTENIEFYDIVFDKSGKYIYTVQITKDSDSNLYENQLVKIDITNGEINTIGTAQKKVGHVDTMFIDAKERYFLLYNEGGFYEVDPKTGVQKAISSSAKLAHLNDGAMCPNATVNLLPTISFEASPEVVEGDSGTTNMVFKIKLDKKATKPITFNYATEDGSDENEKLNAKAGSDYTEKHANKNITNSVEIGIPVIGDNKVEADEQFKLKLSNIQGALYHDSNIVAIGTIKDDDYTKFDAYNKKIGMTNKIMTQIVGQDINLDIEKLNGNIISSMMGVIGLNDVNETKAKLIDTQSCHEGEVAKLVNESGYVSFSNTLKFPASTLASKDMKVQFYWFDKLKKVYRQSCSSDNFAIRPDKFSLTAPSKLKAGEEFTLSAKTLGANGNVVTNYDENITDSFDINYTDKMSNLENNVTVDLSSFDFAQGLASKKVKYSEAGEVDFKISEIVGKEFARVDKDDTQESDRLISSDTKTVEFTAGYLKIENFNLKNEMNGFTYYASKDDIEDMHLELNSTITAYSVDDKVLKNYHSGLYAKNTDLTVKFSKESLSSSTLYWADELELTNHNGDSSANNFVFDINSTRFDQGKANVGIYINFNRDLSQEKEPLRFTINKLSVKDSDDINGTINDSKSTDLYYGRLHAPSYYGEGKEHKIKIDHEVYCQNCDKSKFIYANGKESEDNLYWYKLKDEQYNNGDDAFDHFDHANGDDFMDKTKIPSGIIAATSNGVEYNKIDTMEFEINKAPLKDRIIYEPKPWLIYNKFNKNATTHSFNMSISSSGNWTGKGEKGSTLKGSASRRGSMKMDW